MYFNYTLPQWFGVACKSWHLQFQRFPLITIFPIEIAVTGGGHGIWLKNIFNISGKFPAVGMVFYMNFSWVGFSPNFRFVGVRCYLNMFDDPGVDQHWCGFYPPCVDGLPKRNFPWFIPWVVSIFFYVLPRLYQYIPTSPKIQWIGFRGNIWLKPWGFAHVFWRCPVNYPLNLFKPIHWNMGLSTYFWTIPI